MLTGQLSVKVPGYFNEIFAFFNTVREGKDVYYFRTATQGYYKARSTISGPYRLLPAEIPNNYTALRKYIDEAVTKEGEIRKKKEEQG
jgi:hypothetical protein